VMGGARTGAGIVNPLRSCRYAGFADSPARGPAGEPLAA
jgi:hypothetical protein